MKNYFIVFIIVISLDLWSCNLIPEITYKNLQFVLSIFFLLNLFLHKNKFNKKMNFTKYIFLLIFVQLISILPSLYIHNQQIEYSILIQRSLLGWLFYFTLHYYKINYEKLISIILTIGFTWIIITTIQQITFPNYYFCTRGNNPENIEMRFNIYRFAIPGEQYLILSLYIALSRVLQKNNLNNIFILLIYICGIYLTVTRQLIASAVLCIAIYPIFSTKIKLHTKIISVSTILLALYVVYINADIIFGTMIKTTNEQLDDNVRYGAYNFFLYEHWQGWYNYIFGNGVAHVDSNYGKYIFGINKNVGYIQGDIGIIGMLSTYGIAYIISFTILIIFIIKNIKNKIPGYLNIFFLNLIIIMPMIFFFRSFSGYIFGSILFYLCDCYCVKSKVKMTTNHNYHVNEI